MYIFVFGNDNDSNGHGRFRDRNNAMIGQYSKEMYEAIDYFKRNASKLAYIPNLELETKENWLKGYYFKNGDVNNMFKIFLIGESYGYNRRREEE